MTQVSRRHHIISVFHLRYFTPSAKKREKLWRLDLQIGTWEDAMPEDEACMDDLFSLEGTESPDALETAFNAKIESPAALVFRQMKSTGMTPTGSDLNKVMHYLALILARHPDDIDHWSEFESEVLTIAAALKAHHLDPTIDAKSIRATPTQNRKMASLVLRHEVYHNVLSEKTWTLMTAAKDAGHFVCSDKPLRVIWGPTATNKMADMGQPLLRQPHTLTVMPVNQRMVLVGRYEGAMSPVADRQFIAQINAITSHTSSQFIYSPTKSYDFLRASGDIQDISVVLEDCKNRQQRAYAIAG